jgi:hypothetical protein
MPATWRGLADLDGDLEEIRNAYRSDGAYQERSPLGVLICAPQQVCSGWSIKGCEIGRWRSSRSGQRRRMERPAHGRGLGF